MAKSEDGISVPSKYDALTRLPLLLDSDPLNRYPDAKLSPLIHFFADLKTQNVPSILDKAGLTPFYTEEELQGVQAIVDRFLVGISVQDEAARDRSFLRRIIADLSMAEFLKKSELWPTFLSFEESILNSSPQELTRTLMRHVPEGRSFSAGISGFLRSFYKKCRETGAIEERKSDNSVQLIPEKLALVILDKQDRNGREKYIWHAGRTLIMGIVAGSTTLEECGVRFDDKRNLYTFLGTLRNQLARIYEQETVKRFL